MNAHAIVMITAGLVAFTAAIVLVVKIKGVIAFKETRKKWNIFIAFTALNPAWFVLMFISCLSGEQATCEISEAVLYVLIAFYVVMLLVGFYFVTQYGGVAYRKNQEALRVRSSFLHSVVHDLRTPLNAISGNAELLAEGVVGELSADQRAAVNDIIAGTASLLHIIDAMTAQISDDGFFDLQRLSVDNDAGFFKAIISEMEGKLVEAGQADFVASLWDEVGKKNRDRFFGLRGAHPT